MFSLNAAQSRRYAGVVVAAYTAAFISTAQSNAEIGYGITSNASIITFDTATPGTIITGKAIQGLLTNESIQGLDARPATGQLFALSNFSNIYTISPSTGFVSLFGTLTTTLNGANFGFDFNPAIDRIRIVSDANQNLVFNPADGTTASATPLFYATGDPNEFSSGTIPRDPNVVHSAYDRNFAGTSGTQLFGVDSGLDILVKQANSFGTLTTVGPLGTDVTPTGAFDISGVTGSAYLAVLDATSTKTMFWSVNLTSGAGTLIGEVGGGSTLTAFTVAAVPEPGTIGVVGLALVGLLARRTRSA